MDTLYSKQFQLYICLGYLLCNAVFVVYLGSRQLLQEIIQTKKTKKSSTELMGSGEAMATPLLGSMVLFTVYVLLRFIPLEYFNTLISIYLSIVGIFCLGNFFKAYIRPNIFTGLTCCIIGGIYYWTRNWIANNVLAIGIGVSAIQSVHLDSFKTSFILLLGLFFYDIFWVFGSDVMLTVASGIDGPIKLLFPRTIFEDHQAKSLLGLGDLIVPGLFIAQTLVFSSEYVKRGNFYFYIALVAYFLSLVNTMGVMVFFEHGQPALLFIVPWLLITFMMGAALKGDLKAALKYNSQEVTEISNNLNETENKEETEENSVNNENNSEESLTKIIFEAVLDLFGFGSKDKVNDDQGEKLEKKNN